MSSIQNTFKENNVTKYVYIVKWSSVVRMEYRTTDLRERQAKKKWSVKFKLKYFKTLFLKRNVSSVVVKLGEKRKLANDSRTNKLLNVLKIHRRTRCN